MERKLSVEQAKELIDKLRHRFDKNMHRHPGLEWGKVQAKLETMAKKLWSLNEMESTGGEPDVWIFRSDDATCFGRIAPH